MKHHIENLVHSALNKLYESKEFENVPAFIQIDTTKDKRHGDFASNIAMLMAKNAKKNPREIAVQIIKALPESSYILKAEIAGPGFINFFLTPQALGEIVATILSQKEAYGTCQIGRKKRVLIEFLSSNPTGPLHVGHGRHAAFGAVIGNLLTAVGFEVYREYYLNDAGRQVDILATSVTLRYLEVLGEKIIFPANAYRGDYVIEIARLLNAKYGAKFKLQPEAVFKELPLDEPEGGDKEIYIDEIIKRIKNLLDEQYQSIVDFSLQYIVDDMRNDLTEFGVIYDNWFSERAFVATDAVNHLLTSLKISGHTYEKDHALWFRSTEFADEKDRVLIRSNGQATYFVNDAAYHLYKFERGFDLAIDVFGADHHGYIPRMQAAMQAAGINAERLIHLLVQFVKLYRGKVQIPMSTRGGNFITLRELRAEVGNDAARFFYIMRKSEQPVDFDLELAKAQSNENPVYYIQYAYARISSVLKQLTERGFKFNQEEGLAHLSLLTEDHERLLLNTIARYPDMIINAALQYEPHQLAHFLRDLAADFHAYYNSHHFIVEDAALRNARIALILAVQQVLLNGFNLLGISAPESM